MNTKPTNHTSEKEKLVPFILKMRGNSLPEPAITAFKYYYSKLLNDENGLIPESSITPVESSTITHFNDIKSYSAAGEKYLSRTAIIKLNGGLGTTMGCQGPKSLIEVKNGLSFLQIIFNNLLCFNKRFDTSIPLILMNSFKTEPASLQALKEFPDASPHLPKSFLQNQFPKVLAATLDVAKYPENPELEWNPAGHGDIFAALAGSGLLDSLLEKNYKYAFISNIDNLAAFPDSSIPGYMEHSGTDFLMEVARRTLTDQKGGHIALTSENRFILREIGQCPENDIIHFKNINKHLFFNTNNLWINLESVRSLLSQHNGLIPLPVICNKKHLNPLDLATPEVYQLESAMGSIISLYSHPALLQVPRSRFFPVKRLADLMLIQSDYFELSPDFSLQPTNKRNDPLPNITLDPEIFTSVDSLKKQFPYGIPSLTNCTSLKISGNVQFGKNITINGNAEITAPNNFPFRIPDNSSISGIFPAE